MQHPLVDHFTQTFKFDPSRMVSSGSLVATIPPENINDAKQKLTEKNIIFADIGRVMLMQFRAEVLEVDAAAVGVGGNGESGMRLRTIRHRFMGLPRIARDRNLMP